MTNTAAAAPAAFLGVCTDRSDGNVRSVVTGTSIDEVKDKMLVAVNKDLDADDEPYTLDWVAQRSNLNPAMFWAMTDDYEAFAQILAMP